MFQMFSSYLFACVLSHSVMFTSVTWWTVACQAPLSVKFSRQEYWNGLPFHSPGESSQPKDWTHFSCIAGGFFTTVPPEKTFSFHQWGLKILLKDRHQKVNLGIKENFFLHKDPGRLRKVQWFRESATFPLRIGKWSHQVSQSATKSIKTKWLSSCRDSWGTERRVMVERGQEGNGIHFRQVAASPGPLKWGQEGEMRSQAIAPHEGKYCWEHCVFLLPIFYFLPSGICTPILFGRISFLSLDIVGQDCPSRCPTLHEPSGDPNLVNQIVPNGIWINHWSLFNPASISEMTLHHFLPPGSLNLP